MAMIWSSRGRLYSARLARWLLASAFHEHDLLAPFAKAQKKRQQCDADIEPRAEILHLHDDHPGHHPQEKAQGEHHDVDDDYVLEPEAIGHILSQVDQQHYANPHIDPETARQTEQRQTDGCPNRKAWRQLPAG